MRKMEAADWPLLSDQELLERRVSTLGLRLEGTALEPLIRQLYDELSERRLIFHPPCHVGDEWFVPIGIPAIFIPFFLVHDRLRTLERTMMLEVEGGTSEWFMKLMRHEAGHAYMYAYRLTRKKKWRELFGQTSSEETPDSYRPRPFSRSYVMHLEDWYAQSHPDEDFAESFAVWRRLRLSERQAQDLLRAQTQALRRYVSRLLRCRFAAAVQCAGGNQGERLSATSSSAITECHLPMDKREKVSGEPASCPPYPSLRPAWASRAQRRSTTGFSRLRVYYDAGNELSFHRQIQAHEIA